MLMNVWQRLDKFGKKKHRKDLSWELRILLKQAGWGASNKPMELCEIEVFRYSKNEPDWDGLYGGLKPLLDCLCVYHKDQSPSGLGVIKDDRPKILRKLTAYPCFAPAHKGYTIIKIFDFSHELTGMIDEQKS